MPLNGSTPSGLEDSSNRSDGGRDPHRWVLNGTSTDLCDPVIDRAISPMVPVRAQRGVEE